MKKIVFFLAVLGAVGAGGEELVFQDFDRFLLGPITNQVGWGQVAYIPTEGRVAALVSGDRAYSGANSLKLPWGDPALGQTNSVAMYTNFTARFSGGDNPVLRCSCKVYLETGRETVGAYVGSTLADFIGFDVNTNTGTIFFNETDTGAPVITGRFVDATFWYNMSNHHWAMEYDYQTIVPWIGPDAGSITQFQEFVFMRAYDNASSKGEVFFDDLHVQTFPTDTWAWWRFGEENAISRIREQLGRFAATPAGISPKPLEDTATAPLWADGDYRNTHSCRQPLFGTPQSLQEPSPAVSNWTLEAIFRIDPGALNAAFLHWGTGNGFATNGAMIYAFWRQDFTNLAVTLRDAEQADSSSEHYFSVGFVPADGRWHHAAWVKRNRALLTYVDYVLTSSNNLSSVADGTYGFLTNSHAMIGVALNGGNAASEKHTFDEIRFSTRDLSTHEFLQWGQPLILPRQTVGPLWLIDVRTISGKTYRVESGSSLTNWGLLTNFTATNHKQGVLFPISGDKGFLRAIRQ